MIPIVSVAERIHISAYENRKSTEQTIMEAAPYPYYIICLRFPIAWCELWKIRAMTEPEDGEKKGSDGESTITDAHCQCQRCTIPQRISIIIHSHLGNWLIKFIPYVWVEYRFRCDGEMWDDAVQEECHIMPIRISWKWYDTVRHTNTNKNTWSVPPPDNSRKSWLKFSCSFRALINLRCDLMWRWMILENYGHSVLPSAPPAMVEVIIILKYYGIELIGVCHLHFGSLWRRKNKGAQDFPLATSVLRRICMGYIQDHLASCETHTIFARESKIIDLARTNLNFNSHLHITRGIVAVIA